jgi:hypothetical protein
MSGPADEVRTLVFQQEGVARATHTYQAEQDAALAERDAAAARIFQFQEQVENRTDAMAPKDARIFQLQEQLERFQRNHVDAMAEVIRIQAAEQ